MQARVIRYWNASLHHFYERATNRYLVYSMLTLMTGILTFVALELYALLAPYNQTTLTFQAIYAWETAINFGFCLFLVDTCCGRLKDNWGAFAQRTVGKTWSIWFGAYILAFVVERTLIYWTISIYSPEITEYFDNFPELRPLFWESFLYCLPFWLAIAFALLQTALQQESIIRATKERQSSVSVDGRSSRGSIRLAIGKTIDYLRYDKISHIRIEDHYSRIYLQNGDDTEQILRKISLKDLLALLPKNQFVQIHRSHAVNLAFVTRLKKTNRSHVVFLKNSRTTLPVSRHRLATLRPILKQYIS